MKARFNEEELKEMEKWPTHKFSSGWKSYFKDKPNQPVMHHSVIAVWFGDYTGRFWEALHDVQLLRVSLLPRLHSQQITRRYEAPDFDAVCIIPILSVKSTILTSVRLHE